MSIPWDLGGPLCPLGEEWRTRDIVAPAAVASPGEDMVAQSKVAPALSAPSPSAAPEQEETQAGCPQLSFLHPHPHCRHHHCHPENVSASSCFISLRAPPFVTIFVPITNLAVAHLPF